MLVKRSRAITALIFDIYQLCPSLDSFHEIGLIFGSIGNAESVQYCKMLIFFGSLRNGWGSSFPFLYLSEDDSEFGLTVIEIVATDKLRFASSQNGHGDIFVF